MPTTPISTSGDMSGRTRSASGSSERCAARHSTETLIFNDKPCCLNPQVNDPTPIFERHVCPER
jgi:hypothetical protein